MSFLCRIGLHKWKATYRRRETEDFVLLALFGPYEWTGHTCARCRLFRPIPVSHDDGNYD